MRLDLVVSKIIKQSRSKTDIYMREKKVLVNYDQTSKIQTLKIGDVLSIEKCGKFIIDDIEVISSKNKIKVKIKKYC